jgi:hypothetical protein
MKRSVALVLAVFSTLHASALTHAHGSPQAASSQTTPVSTRSPEFDNRLNHRPLLAPALSVNTAAFSAS